MTKRNSTRTKPTMQTRRETRRAVIRQKSAFLIDAATRAAPLALAIFAFAPNADAADLTAQFQAVCESAFVKSERLQKACADNDAPTPLKDGRRFAANGYGAEVNALASNLHLIANPETGR